jgi:hypothetical protein
MKSLITDGGVFDVHAIQLGLHHAIHDAYGNAQMVICSEYSLDTLYFNDSEYMSTFKLIEMVLQEEFCKLFYYG